MKCPNFIVAEWLVFFLSHQTHYQTTAVHPADKVANQSPVIIQSMKKLLHAPLLQFTAFSACLARWRLEQGFF